MNAQFPSCGNSPLGLYPVVDSPEWLEKLLPLGVTTIQLRIKNITGKQLELQIQQSIQLAQRYNARLFINDYWQLAIKYGAYGVHLGQEDVITADSTAIYQAGLRLGISTHSPFEIKRALAFKPSYLAFGPIYPTTTKIMPYEPQGIARLHHWVEALDCPVVAIGGINQQRLPKILATGVSGLAVLSAITKAQDPVTVAKHLWQIIHKNQARYLVQGAPE